jgi:hypothetical protein
MKNNEDKRKVKEIKLILKELFRERKRSQEASFFLGKVYGTINIFKSQE